MKKTIFASLVISAVLAVSGCATTTPVSQRVKSFRLESQVEAPDTATYHGRASNFKWDGLIGAAIASADDDEATLLTKFLRKEEIDVPHILFSQFSERLQGSSLGSKLQESATFRMTLKVEQYGLGKGWGPANNMRPSASVRVTLVDENGKVVWSKFAGVGGATTELPIQKLDQWLANPDALRNAYVQVANMLADQLLDGL
jgi:hypothetical protein